MTKFSRKPNLLFGLAALLILMAAFACGGEESQDVDSRPDIVVVLDASAVMEESFEDGTKIETAVATVNQLVENLPESSLGHLALRRYGGPCEGNNTEVVFPFNQRDGAQLRKELENLAVAGGPTLNKGIEAAAMDFADSGRSTGVRRAIIVAGAGDSCGGSLSEQLAKLDAVEIEVTFIGMGIAAAQREGLDIEAAGIGGRIFFVQTRRELAEALLTILSELAEDPSRFMALVTGSQTQVPTATPAPSTSSTGNAGSGAATPTPTPSPVSRPTPTLVPLQEPNPTPTIFPSPTPPPTLVPVVPTFLPSPGEGVVPLDVTFTATPAQGISEYRWDFDGDGAVDQTTQSNAATHSYQASGTFNPTVTVVDNQAQMHMVATTVIVCPSQIAISASEPPQVFAGTASIDGQDAPEGTIVVARIGCESLGETTVGAGKYSMLVTQPTISSYSGSPVEFVLGGFAADQTAIPVVGSADILNLTAATN